MAEVEPQYASDYDDRTTVAVKSVLVEIGQILGSYKGKFAVIGDSDHSVDEDWFVLIGMSLSLRTLAVCHCYREDDEVIRIISARKANRMERAEYERRWAR